VHLPFSRSDFLDVFAAYNTALWPAVLALWLGTAVALIAVVRGRRSSRFVSGLLAFHWAWAAVAYHAAYFARINPAAPLFAGLFLLQAALFFWSGVATGRLTFSWAPSPRHFVGLGLSVYALAYPLLSLLFGHEYPRMPTFGVPCPTTLLTAGLLLIADLPLHRWLVVIPIIWSVVGGSAAVFLGVTADLMLFVAGGLMALYSFVPSVHWRPRAT